MCPNQIENITCLRYLIITQSRRHGLSHITINHASRRRSSHHLDRSLAVAARLEVPAPSHIASHLVSQLDQQRPSLAGQRRAGQVGNCAVRLQDKQSYLSRCHYTDVMTKPISEESYSFRSGLVQGDPKGHFVFRKLLIC